MGTVLAKLISLVSYLCIATVLAAAVSFSVLRVHGTLSDEALQRIRAILNGTDQAQATARLSAEPADRDVEQPSYADRQAARDLRVYNMERREQSLRRSLDVLRSEQQTLTADKTRYESQKTDFEARLKSLRDVATSSGRENVRLVWENIRPKQAKDQIVQMLATNDLNEVVALFAALPIESRARIAGEFKTQEEIVQLDNILRKIREGAPEVTLIDSSLKQIQH